MPRDPAPGGRDVREFGWWVFDQVARGSMPSRDGTALAAILRALHSLGPEPASEEERLREIALHGQLMHGQSPRDEEQWALAASLFTDDALEEFRRWTN